MAGVLVLGLLLGARSLHLRSQAEDAAWVQAVGTIEADVAISHLWLEEYVSGDEVDLEDLVRRLTSAGYHRTDRVESRGEIAVRGGIVDDSRQ